MNGANKREELNEQYQTSDSQIIDYRLSPFEGSELKVRSAIDASKPFGAVIGAAATFGRFVTDPFPEILGRKNGTQVLNLGFPGAGPGFFLRRPELLTWINKAEFVIVESMSGRTLGNVSSQENSESGMAKGRANYPFRPTTFEGDPSTAIGSTTQQRLLWFQEMTELLRRISVRRKCLLWFSKRKPEYNQGLDNVIRYWADMPQYVNRDLLNELIQVSGIDFVEVVSKEGLPQKLVDMASNQPIELWPKERFPGVKARHHNHFYPSPQMHEICARAVSDWLKAGDASPGPPLPSKSRRRIIAHHHIFKNAGSSLDKAFSDTLGERWRAFDPQIVTNDVENPVDGKIAKKAVRPEVVGSDELEKFLNANLDVYAISTHQGRAKFPLGANFEKLELSLIRNPIGRALSMWKFNRRPERQTNYDSKMLKQSDLLSFEDFIKWCTNRKSNPLAPFSNFQVRVLSGKLTMNGRVTYSDLNRAVEYVTRIGCVGVVERFDRTLEFFNARIRTFIPGIELTRYTVNTSGAGRESGDEEARQLLSKRTYELLLDANALDLALYDQVLRVGDF
jgi:Domain of unknown function (DUF6473)